MITKRGQFILRRKFRAGLERMTQPLRAIWPRFPQAVLGLLALVIVGFGLLTYNKTVTHYFGRISYGNRYLALIDGYLNPFRNRHVLLNSGLPIYDLKISRQEYAKLEQVAEKARRQGWMSDDLKVWADAKFICNRQSYNIKLRLRGDLPNHWTGAKKSWAIKFGKQPIQENGEVRKVPNFFQGKRRINLIIPRDRDFVIATFVNEIMREKGLAVPRDQFVVLRINGTLQGLYYEVENFDKPLFAAQRRPETAVLGQNNRAMHFEQYTKYGTPGTADAKYDIGSVRRSVDDESQSSLPAMEVLIEHSLDPTPENFRRVQLVLDWEKYLQFRAITTLLNTNHVRFGSDNLKLYHDSSRGLLEPIPWDVHLVRMPIEPGTIDFFNAHGPDELQRATLLEPRERLRRNKVIWEMVADGGDDLISKYRSLHDQIRPFAWADVLSTPIQGYKMDVLKKVFEHNVRRVHKVLGHSSANLTYRLEDNRRASVEINATNFCGIRLNTLTIADPVLDGEYRLHEDVNHDGELDANDVLVAVQTAEDHVVAFALDQYVLPRIKYVGAEVDGRYWEYFDTLGGRRRYFLVGNLTPAKREFLQWQSPELELSAVNAVTGTPLSSSVADLPTENAIGITAYDASHPFDIDAPQLTQTEFLQAHPEFAASRDHVGAVELSTAATISGTVIVPHQVPLILRAGTQVTMMPDANLVCFGGLTALGTPEKPIRIQASEAGEPWGTFAAVRPAGEVVMRHVEMRDGGQAHVNGILFTGGFAVHDGNLRLENCQFVEMQSEDAINLKNGHLVMQDCVVASSASDAIDVDFGTGEIRNCLFRGAQGDGVDLSGSQLTIRGNRFENIQDKGTSVGEDSHPTIVDNVYTGCEIGISVKDLSFARVANCTFANNKLAIEAKRKKPMFGPGSGEFVNCVFTGNQVVKREDYFSRGRVEIK